jgi:hypothetical protein
VQWTQPANNTPAAYYQNPTPVVNTAPLPMPSAPPATYYTFSTPAPAPMPGKVESLNTVEPNVTDAPAKVATPEPIQAPKDAPGTATPPPPIPALPSDYKGCQGGSPVIGCPIQQPCYYPHFSIFGEFLYWNVRDADVPFAQSFDGVGPLSVPRGQVAMAQPDYAPGFRVGGAYAICENRWLVATFTWFHTATDSDTAAVPGTALRALLVFPNTLNSAADSLTASARYEFSLQMADVDYKCPLWSCDSCRVNWLVGARYAHLDQDLQATYSILGTTTVDSHITFDGGGVRGGFDGEYKVKCGAFGYAKGVVNLLAGHFAGNYEQRNIFTGLQAQTGVSEDRLVPILEFEAGVGWESPQGHVRLSGGYSVSSWFNTLTTPSLVQGVQNVNYTTNGNNFRDNLTFEGFVGRIEIRY